MARFWRRDGGTPDPHAGDPLERARGIRFTAQMELELLSAGEPWNLYKGRSGERIAAAVGEARAALDRAGAADRTGAGAADVLPPAEAAQAAVTHVSDLLGEVRRATARRAKLAPDAEDQGQRAAAAVAGLAATGLKVDPLVLRLHEASRLLDDAEDAAADPLTTVAALERSLAITQQVLDAVVDLPFRAERAKAAAEELAGRIADARRRAGAMGTQVDGLGRRWAEPTLQPLAGLVADVARLVDLADRHRASAAEAADAQEWDAAEAAEASAAAALDDVDRRLAEPARLDADLTAQVAAARTRAEGTRTVLRWNRSTRPDWSPKLDLLDERLDAALNRLGTPPVDVASVAAELAAVDDEVRRLDQRRVAEAAAAPAGPVWGQGGDQPWNPPPRGPRGPFPGPPWGRRWG